MLSKFTLALLICSVTSMTYSDEDIDDIVSLLTKRASLNLRPGRELKPPRLGRSSLYNDYEMGDQDGFLHILKEKLGKRNVALPRIGKDWYAYIGESKTRKTGKRSMFQDGFLHVLKKGLQKRQWLPARRFGKHWYENFSKPGIQSKRSLYQNGFLHRRLATKKKYSNLLNDIMQSGFLHETKRNLLDSILIKLKQDI